MVRICAEVNLETQNGPLTVFLVGLDFGPAGKLVQGTFVFRILFA